MVNTETSGGSSLEPGDEGAAREARVDRAATDREQALSDRDQTASDQDQSASDDDQTGSESDSAASARDQRSSDQDQKTADANLRKMTSMIPPSKGPTKSPAANGNRPRRIARPRKATAPEPPRVELEQLPGAMRPRRRVTTRRDYATPLRNAWKRRSSPPTSRWHEGSSS